MCIFELVILFFLDIYPGVELLGHVVVLFLGFWETSILFSIVAAPFYIPTNSVQGFSFLHTQQHLFFACSHSDTCEVIAHCGFNLNFWWLLISSIFFWACWPFVCLLWKNIFSGLRVIFFYCVFYIELYELYILGIIPWWSYLQNTLSHSIDCLFILSVVSCALQKFLNLFVHFCFYVVCLRRHIQKYITTIYVKVWFCLCSHLGVLWFGVFDPFGVNFCTWYEEMF